MKAANVNRSDRLRRVLTALKRSKRKVGITTREIIAQANVCAVSACFAELRANGYDIHCQRKGDVWTYRLMGETA